MKKDFRCWIMEMCIRDRVNEQGYEEGEPDGTSGQVYLNCMSPEPENDYVCDILTTDPDGYARHSDTRYYNYSKTYCMSHPAPEWTECDHEEDEDCSCCLLYTSRCV